MFVNPFSIAITAKGGKSCSVCFSCVCLFCACLFVSLSSFSWYQDCVRFVIVVRPRLFFLLVCLYLQIGQTRFIVMFHYLRKASWKGCENLGEILAWLSQKFSLKRYDKSWSWKTNDKAIKLYDELISEKAFEIGHLKTWWQLCEKAMIFCPENTVNFRT